MSGARRTLNADIKAATRLHELKLRNGVTQGMVAVATGINQSTMNDYFKASNVPNVYRAEKIANYFGVKVTDIWKVEEV